MFTKHFIVYERAGGGAGTRKSGRRGTAARSPRRQAVRAGQYAYAAVFEPAPEGGYVVRFPAFGYLATQGETLAQARAMAADCLEGRIACMREEGEDLPPSDVFSGMPWIEVIRVKPNVA